MEIFVQLNSFGLISPSAGKCPKHSFEFDRDNNWDKLEKICEKLSGHDDIWYATNIEIYEYTNAYNSLVYSADGSRIYNPTLYTLWFEINKVMYTIKPDEIVKIEEN